jgi:hypothetical protein
VDDIIHVCSQADKIKALEDAGVVVTPSPAKIGVTMERIFKERVSLFVMMVYREHAASCTLIYLCMCVSGGPLAIEPEFQECLSASHAHFFCVRILYCFSHMLSLILVHGRVSSKNKSS